MATVVLYLIVAFAFSVVIFMVTLSGYFFTRIVLKILGLHKGTEQQCKNEKKLAILFAAIILFLVIVLVASLFVPEQGLTKMGAS